ncbi:venom phosphodiesterase 2-like [Pristis pectinata]|uniref:venom phosphodiesterase 2-like n=1 Tax=Pristis pectinata TaxID=685728 RepID=UPI00223D3232|nr:venom phosphodiesterase 2-like [Pristis pectinata]
MDVEGAKLGCEASFSSEQQRESMLHADAEPPAKSRRHSRRCRVLIAVLLALLLILLLGLGLGLGLRSCRFKPADSWTCSQSRCGEKRFRESRCSCSDDCIQKKDCCTDYKSTCKGEKSWLQEDCEDVATPHCPAGFTRPPVILFSLDGFRADYFQKWKSHVPVLNKLRTCGVHTPYLIPVYPTKTFPNHYSIITGLYPESHGVIDNSMYDVDMNALYNIREEEKNNPLWYKGQPLWLTAMYQGLKTGTFFWVGSESKINGSYPNMYKLFDSSIQFEERVFTILKWLDLPREDRPDFYALYLEEPDDSGHKGGPNSKKLANALERVDTMVGMLMDGLKQRNLLQCVNLIVISDHGMEEVDCSKIAYMESYLDNVEDIYIRSGPAPRLRSKTVPENYFKFDSEGVVKKLACRSSDQHFIPYLKHHLPKRLHYASSRRIEDVNLYMDPQWQAGLKPPFKYCTGGFHGSDNQYKNMQTIFVGHGPGFKTRTEVQPFSNIEVYNLMCDLLNITPAPNNGTHGSLNHLLKKPVYTPTHLKEASSASSCFSSDLIPTVNPQMKCTCSSLASLPESACKELRLSLAEAQVADSKHLPYGRPRVVQENCKWCLLRQHSYVSGYSQNILMPSWSAYTVLKTESLISPLPNIPNCVLVDVRIPLTTNQSLYAIGEHNETYGFLYPPNLLSDHYQFEGLFTSNLVPMYKAFQKIWNYFHNVLLVKYALRRNGINVISGPVFDFDFNGQFDTPNIIAENSKETLIPIPTHYYIVLTSCKNKMESPLQCNSALEVLAFILPHRPDNSESCADGKDESQWVEERIWAHRARVRDVELITGLDFYQERKQPVPEILQLKTYLPKIEDQI